MESIEKSELQCTPNSGLLTFSNTNLISNIERQIPYSAFQLFRFKSQFESTPKNTQIRKPRVNFHSIDDIVNGGKTNVDDSIEDSGIQSASNTASNVSNFESPQQDYTDDDKENDAKKNNFSANNKKIRTTFTDQQKWMLEQYFHQNPYPDPRETEELSKQLSLAENVIKVWFQNKRSRDKQRKFSKQNVTTTSTPSKANNNEENIRLINQLVALHTGQLLKMY